MASCLVSIVYSSLQRRKNLPRNLIDALIQPFLDLCYFQTYGELPPCSYNMRFPTRIPLPLATMRIHRVWLVSTTFIFILGTLWGFDYIRGPWAGGFPVVRREMGPGGKGLASMRQREWEIERKARSRWRGCGDDRRIGGVITALKGDGVWRGLHALTLGVELQCS